MLYEIKASDGRGWEVGAVVIGHCSGCEEDVWGDPEEHKGNDDLGDGMADTITGQTLATATQAEASPEGSQW